MTFSQFVYLARPHTWSASLAPVVVAFLLALYRTETSVNLFVFVLCLCIALTAQSLSNVLNDLFDYKKGTDTQERKGFQRLLASGKVSVAEIKIVALIWASLLAILGIILSGLVSWWLLIIGVLVFLGAWGYSAGKKSFSSNALGDVAVILFFGWIAVGATYYVLTQQIDYIVMLVASSLGVAIDNILVVNNYRDYEEDISTGKTTLIVKTGKAWGPKIYILNAVLSILCLYPIHTLYSILLAGLYLIEMWRMYRKMKMLQGAELNKLLVHTGIRIWALVGIIFVALLSSLHLF